jgi:hypothetical protein
MASCPAGGGSPSWGWVCNRILDCLNAYSSGVTPAILLSDLLKVLLLASVVSSSRLSCVHTDVHSCIYECLHTDVPSSIHACIHTDVPSCMYTGVHSCMRTYGRICIQIPTHPCFDTDVHMHACMHAYALHAYALSRVRVHAYIFYVHAIRTIHYLHNIHTYHSYIPSTACIHHNDVSICGMCWIKQGSGVYTSMTMCVPLTIQRRTFWASDEFLSCEYLR